MSDEEKRSNGSGCGCSLGFGNLIAAIISYAKWGSIGWAIVHSLLSWVYVLYYLIKYG